jgi:hypothetical protein
MESVENDIDSYLKDAGVPLPPHGFTWFIRNPAGVRGDPAFWSAFTGAVYDQVSTQAPTPREIATAAAIIMDRFYQRSSR